MDAAHDLLLSLGPLCPSTNWQPAIRTEASSMSGLIRSLDIVAPYRSRRRRSRSICSGRRCGTTPRRFGRCLSASLPDAFAQAVDDPLGDLIMRYARAGSFTVAALASHYGLGVSIAQEVLGRLNRENKVVSGEFLPGGNAYPNSVKLGFCDASSEPLLLGCEPRSSVSHPAFARFALDWHGITQRRRGLDAFWTLLKDCRAARYRPPSLKTIF